MIKNKKDAGADQSTPSIPQYFSWINNSNEGATEEQTLINLNFFDYMRRTYGMQIALYAWDAGNFDGARGHYGAEEMDKIKAQYPNGYGPVVERAKEIGIQMGLWGSPDGYGDDPQTEKDRYEFFVHLCRDYHFGLFKLDGVCGNLRPEKAELFAKMLQECRQYSPDLVVLNHRLNLYEAEKYVTTFLFNGDETYVDVLSQNPVTAMHHRAFMFSRGHVDGLNRLAEDHGVCISSCVDYFEDELIYQAFGRCLILAPEIYGNPWLLRDDELPKLARVYNLHRRNASILVDGFKLPAEYGCDAVVRGSETKRFITTGNNTWETKTIQINLGEIGLKTDENVLVRLHHPFEKHLGEYRLQDTVEVDLLPFRATLIEISVPKDSEPMLENCAYEIVQEDADGTPLKVIVFEGETECACTKAEPEKVPLFLGELTEKERYPKNGEFLYESAMFAVDNDSLERRTIKRSGPTAIPEVQTARDAFFNQKHYKLRGCDNANLFDGDPNTFFDSQSRYYLNQALRIDGGCLRVDFGDIFEADGIEIECFIPDHPTDEVPAFTLPYHAETSCDLRTWTNTGFPVVSNMQDSEMEIIRFSVHDTYSLKGSRAKIVYPIEKPVRYLRIPQPMDRIFTVKLICKGEYLSTIQAKANNMMASYRFKHAELVKSNCFTLPNIEKTCKLAVALEGEHGNEAVYCVAEVDGKVIGAPERAPEYPANNWEHKVCSVNKNYTYFIPVEPSMSGKEIKVQALFVSGSNKNIQCNVFLCDLH